MQKFALAVLKRSSEQTGNKTVIYRYSSDLLGLRMCSDTCHSDVQIKRSELRLLSVYLCSGQLLSVYNIWRRGWDPPVMWCCLHGDFENCEVLLCVSVVRARGCLRYYFLFGRHYGFAASWFHW